MVIIKIFIFIIGFIIAQFPNEKLYVSIQMMDQVGIINTENYQYDFTIEIEMQNNSTSNCMEIEDEMDCSMLDGCEWMMEMCMDSSSSDNCINYNDEMSCELVDGCVWMMGACMDNMDSEQAIKG